MNKGDVLEWKTVNGVCRGVATESENGESMVRVDEMTVFFLKDIIKSKNLLLKGNTGR